MSRSHKKCNIKDISLLSFTEKMRQPSLSHSKKVRNEKQNINDGRSLSKIKQDTKSSKKDKKKRFLQEEVEKMLQKRYVDSDAKFKEIKEKNTQEITGLKEDLRSMKEAISRLAFEEKTTKPEQKQKESDGELQMICLGYRRKISEMQEELGIQKLTNAQLEEAHIQSQVFAQQTKDFSESIKQELQELATKHVKCEQNARDLEIARRQIRMMQVKSEELEETIRKYQIIQQRKIQEIQMLQESLVHSNQENQRLKSCLESATLGYNKLEEQFKRVSIQMVEKDNTIGNQDQKIKELEEQTSRLRQRQSEISSAKEQLQVQMEEKVKMYEDKIKCIQNQCQQLVEQKQLISESFLKKFQVIHSNLQQALDQKQTAKSQNQALMQLIDQLRQQLALERQSRSKVSSLQLELKKAQMQMGKATEKVDIGGLASMQKKCSQLYQQIKKEKLKWDLLNAESNSQKKTFSIELATERQAINNQIKNFECTLGQSLKTTERLRAQKEIYEAQMGKLTLENREIKENLKLKQSELCIMKQEKGALMQKMIRQSDKLKENESQLIIERAKLWQLQQNMKRLLFQKESLEKNKICHQYSIKLLEKTLSQVKVQRVQFQKELTHHKSILQEKQSENCNLQLQNKQLKIQISKHQEAYGELKQARQKLIIQSEKYKEMISQLQTAKSHHQEQNIKNEKETKIWKDKCFSTQKLLQNEKHFHNQCKQKLVAASENRNELLLEISKLTDSTTRSNDQLKWYENEISLKNKSIYELKQAIKMVKQESLRIKDEVKAYQQEFKIMNERNISDEAKLFGQLTKIAHKQIEYMRNRLNDLQSDKVDIQIQMKNVVDKNKQLEQKLASINISFEGLISLSQHEKVIQQIQDQLSLQKQSRDKQFTQLKDKIISEQQNIKKKQEKIEELNAIISSYDAQLKQEIAASSNLTEIIEQKEQIIQILKEKCSSNDEKKVKIVDEIRSIQAQIGQLAEKNSALEQENKELSQRLKETALTLNDSKQKIQILVQNEKALQEQKQALADQSQLFKLETTRSRQRQSQLEERKLKELRQIHQSYEQRSTQEINALKESIDTLKHTIKDLANELANSVNKLNAKNEEIEKIKEKYSEIQSILKENHQLLDEERNQREKISAVNNQLNLCIENYKLQVISKGKQIESLAKQKSILKSKLVELESKYQLLRGKYENIEQQKQQARKEIQNQSLTLRVLREENKNIEKVMSDQLNQRKTIIEQLVNEKKMLYNQLKQ